MKLRTLLATMMIASATVGTVAQNKDTKVNSWFIQPQLGATYSFGDNSFGKLVSPAGQLSFGKNLNDGFAARLSVSGWRGRGGNGEGLPGYGFYYGAATVDGIFNLSKLFGDKNQERRFTTSLIAGVGYNSTFGNRKDGGFMGRAGLQGKYSLNKAFSLNVEALFNGVSDKWNNQDDHTFDSYVNLLVGISFNLGSGINWGCPDCDVVYYDNVYDEEYVQTLNDKINELRAQLEAEQSKPAPETAPTPTPAVVRDHLISYVLFGLAKTNVEDSQMMNIMVVSEYLKKYPDVKVSLTGYADKATGNATINAELAQKRAEAVAEVLHTKYGIAKERMIVDSKGDSEQLFPVNEKNRVVVMLAE